MIQSASFFSKKGFTLVEVLVFISIFAVSAVFLLGILTTVTRTQLRQASVNEVSEQVGFVSNTVQRLVRESSLVENEPGVASTTLVLRRASSTVGITKIFKDPGNIGIYLQEFNEILGTSTTVPLTNNKVKVNTFSVTRYQSSGGPAVVQVDLTLEANTTNPQAQISKSWRGAVTRISAATFDSTIAPSQDNSLNIGVSESRWKDAYFSGNIYILGRIGLGVDPSLSAKIKSNGDIAVTNPLAGLILTRPGGGGCVRITLNTVGNIVTSTVACP